MRTGNHYTTFGEKFLPINTQNYFFYFQPKEEKKEEPKTSSDSDSDIEEMRKKFVKSGPSGYKLPSFSAAPNSLSERGKMLKKVRKISTKIGQKKGQNDK